MAQASLNQEAMYTNFSFPSHSNKILQGLNKQRLDSSLCDVTITVQGQQYKAHKAVLAAYSLYFHGMFTVNWLSSEGDLVMELDGVTSRAFDSLLKLIYTSVLTVSSTIISEVLSAATYLDMPDVVAVCNQYMEKNASTKVGEETYVGSEDQGAGPAGLEVGDSDEDDVETEPAIFANAEDDWTINLQDISSAAKSGEASMKEGREETDGEPKAPRVRKQRRWKDEHGSFTCETCGKHFTSRNSYKQHMYGHRSGKRHACKVAGPKVLKPQIVKSKKKKLCRRRVWDPVDGSKVGCACGVNDKEHTTDRCHSTRCPCYQGYRACDPSKCYCRYCVNKVPRSKIEPDPVAKIRCSCGKNDKDPSNPVQRCVMSIRCACSKAQQPCGKSCRCFSCGNKAESSGVANKDPPKGEGRSNVEENLKQMQAYRDRFKVIEGSVGDILKKMRTSGIPYEKVSLTKSTRVSKAPSQVKSKKKAQPRKRKAQAGEKKKAQAEFAKGSVGAMLKKMRTTSGTAHQTESLTISTEGENNTQETASRAESGHAIPLSKIPEGVDATDKGVNRDVGNRQNVDSQPSSSTNGAHNGVTSSQEKTTDATREEASAVAGILPARVQTDPTRPLPTVAIVPPSAQAQRAVGVQLLIRMPNGSVLQPARPSGPVSILGGNSGMQPSITGIQPVQPTSSPLPQPVRLIGPINVTGSSTAVPPSNTLVQPSSIASIERVHGSTDSTQPVRLIGPLNVTGSSTAVSSSNTVVQPSSIAGNEQVHPVSVTGPMHGLATGSASKTPQRLENDSPQASRDQSEEVDKEVSPDEGPKETTQDGGTESLLEEDHPEQSTSYPKRLESTVDRLCQKRASPEKPDERPSQSLQPVVVLERLQLTSDHVIVNVTEVDPCVFEDVRGQTSSQANVAGMSSDNNRDIDQQETELQPESTASTQPQKKTTSGARKRKGKPTALREQDAEEEMAISRAPMKPSLHPNKARAPRAKKRKLKHGPIPEEDTEKEVAATTVKPSSKPHKDGGPKKKAPRAKKRKRAVTGEQDLGNEMATSTGIEPAADVGPQGAQGDSQTWSSRLRKGRTRTWLSRSGEWVFSSDESEIGESDDSFEDKNYTGDSESAEEDVADSLEEEVGDMPEEESMAIDEEESAEQQLEHRKKVLLKMQKKNAKRKVRPNTIGDILKEGEDTNKSSQDVMEKEKKKLPVKRKRQTAKRPKKGTQSASVRKLLKLKRGQEDPKEVPKIPNWLEEWKKSLPPGIRHTGQKEGKEGGTSSQSVEQSNSAGGSGSTTQQGQGISGYVEANRSEPPHAAPLGGTENEHVMLTENPHTDPSETGDKQVVIAANPHTDHLSQTEAQQTVHVHAAQQDQDTISRPGLSMGDQQPSSTASQMQQQ